MLSKDTPAGSFTRDQVVRMTGITHQQFGRWERLGLFSTRDRTAQAYGFADLVSLRTLRQLTGEGAPPKRLSKALAALRRMFDEVEEPLRQMRLVWDGHRLAADYEGRTIEPLSGQLLLKFNGEGQKLRVMPDRSPGQWLEIALQCEGNRALRRVAMEAYQHVIDAAPDWVQPVINLGTLHYEAGNLEAALAAYRQAIFIAPGNPLAHFNLGSVLDELKRLEEAAGHLREAVELKPEYADAHYNLARVYDEMGAHSKARPHWRRYLELDSSSSWADYARERLAMDDGARLVIS